MCLCILTYCISLHHCFESLFRISVLRIILLQSFAPLLVDPCCIICLHHAVCTSLLHHFYLYVSLCIICVSLLLFGGIILLIHVVSSSCTIAHHCCASFVSIMCLHRFEKCIVFRLACFLLSFVCSTCLYHPASFVCLVFFVILMHTLYCAILHDFASC